MTTTNDNTGAASGLSAAAGSVERLKQTHSMLDLTTEAAHFYGEDLENLKADIEAALLDHHRLEWLFANLGGMYWEDEDGNEWIVGCREGIDEANLSLNGKV